MKFTTAVVAALVAAVNVAAQSAPLINTPSNVVVCQPLLINWSGGTPPYFLSVVPANQPGAAALVDFGQLNGTSITWNVNLPVGTSVNLNLRDSTGQLGQTAPFSILTGSNTTCVGKDLSTSAGPAAPTTAPPANTGATTPPATTTPPAGTGSTTKASTSSTGAPATTSKAAGFQLVGQVGAVGAFAAAVIAALA